MRSLLLFTAFVASSYATPLNDLSKRRQAACSHIAASCTGHVYRAHATDFCGYQLSVPTQTVTAAVTSVTVTTCGIGSSTTPLPAVFTRKPNCFPYINESPDAVTSACACLSLPSTITTTVTATTTINSAAIPSNFLIYSPNSAGPGQYANVDQSELEFDDATANNDTFTLNQAGNIVYTGSDQDVTQDGMTAWITYLTPSLIPPLPLSFASADPAEGGDGEVALQPVCSISPQDDGTCPLTCSVPGASTNWACTTQQGNNIWTIAPSNPDSIEGGTCDTFTPLVVSV